MNNLSESPARLINTSGINRRFNKSANTYDQSASIQVHIAKILSDQLPDAHTLSVANNHQGIKPSSKTPLSPLSDTAPLSILEIGCGTGHLSTHLLNQYPEASLTITDFSEPMLSIAKNKISSMLQERDANNADQQLISRTKPQFQKLNPETDLINHSGAVQNKYDLIVSSMAIHWFENCEHTLNLISKQLKPNGNLYISTIGPECFPEWRETLKSLNLPLGLRTLPPLNNIIHEETITKSYGSAANFLTELKKTGAHSPRPGYKPLTPNQLRTAMTKLDEKYNGSLTWHIQYARFGSK